jgi:hypothetical protein
MRTLKAIKKTHKANYLHGKTYVAKAAAENGRWKRAIRPPNDDVKISIHKEESG